MRDYEGRLVKRHSWQFTTGARTASGESSGRSVFPTERLVAASSVIGSRQPFCHNPLAMRAEWRKYLAVMPRYLWYVPCGMLIALAPFLFNLDYWQQRGSVLTGFVVSLIFGLTVSLTIWLIYALVFAALTLIHIKIGRRYYRISVLFTVALNGFSIAAGVWLALLVKGRLLGEPAQSFVFLPSLVFGGLVALLFTFHFAYRRAKEDALELRAAVAEAKYNALEHQMRPHFLFNALNSLAELIESGQERAAEMAYTLSELYRQILAHAGLKTAPLRSEAEIAQRYLELEQVRFGRRLTFSINLPDEADEIYLPSLMLQTLVENAVKHGVSPSVDGGHVTVEVGRTPRGSYQLSVINTGERYQRNGAAGTGIANTRARLDLLYGESHEFSLHSDEAGRTVASFCFSGERID